MLEDNQSSDSEMPPEFEYENTIVDGHKVLTKWGLIELMSDCLYK